MNCWIKQPDGSVELDEQALYETLAGLRGKVEVVAEKWRNGDLEGVASPCEHNDRASNE